MNYSIAYVRWRSSAIFLATSTIARRCFALTLALEELEQLRRSIAILQPGSMAMKREDAMRLLGDLGEVQARLDHLCNGLRALLNKEAGQTHRAPAGSTLPFGRPMVPDP